jgi:hyaluronan synthase
MAARSLAFQLFAMASQSVAGGQVLIAPGAFSLFRGGLLRDVKDAYVGETFAGIPVTLGDDTMLTFFALMRGRVVQQPSAVCFPAYPERLSHHLRQWTRWMRASTIRQVWRLRYLPLASYGFWFSVWQLGAFTAGVAATAFVIVAWPASVPLLYGALGGLLGWPLILASRLFCVRRSDQSWLGVWAGVALMPFAALWYLLVLRQIRFYGMWTAARQGWVTRKKVEVRLHEGES